MKSNKVSLLSDLIEEKEFNNIKLEIEKEKVKNLQDKESFIDSLPYNEDYARYI